MHAWILAVLSSGIASIRPICSVETNFRVLHIAFESTSRETVIGLGSILVVVNNDVSSFALYWRVCDCFFFLTTLLASCYAISDTGQEWWGTVFVFAGWIDFRKRSVVVDPYNTGTANVSTTMSVTPVSVSPVCRWRVIVYDELGSVSNVLRTFEMFRWWILFSQQGSRTWHRLKFGSAPMSKTQTVGHRSHKFTPIDTL